MIKGTGLCKLIFVLQCKHQQANSINLSEIKKSEDKVLPYFLTHCWLTYDCVSTSNLLEPSCMFCTLPCTCACLWKNCVWYQHSLNRSITNTKSKDSSNTLMYTCLRENTHTHTYPPPPTHTHSCPPFHYTHTQHPHSNTHKHPLPPPLPHTHTFTLSLSLSLSRTHTHTHTHTLRHPIQTNNQMKTRGANAQMIHICHTYRTSSQSSPLHNQPLQIFELLYATLQQHDCTSSSFPITLLPWENIKVIQTGIKLWRLVVFRIISSLNKLVDKCPDTWWS